MVRSFLSAIGLLGAVLLICTAGSCSRPSDTLATTRRTDSKPAPSQGSAGSSLAETNKKRGEEFLAANQKKEGVKTLPSGVQYVVLKEGTGKQPKVSDSVTLHYQGSTIDGKVFYSSVKMGEPARFYLVRVIPGWHEVLPLMKVGSKWRVFIPPKLAYGGQGNTDVGPNETLIYEIELLKINSPLPSNSPDE